MPNSFTVFPNVLPGNVTIGGNLTITGDQVRIGAAAPFFRVGKRSGGQGFLSHNVGFDFATRDSAGVTGWILNLDQVSDSFAFAKFNSAGNFLNEGYTSALFTDYTDHTHTGTTTQDTIYSKVIRAGIIGANGCLTIEFFVTVNGQGAPATTVGIGFNGSNSTLFTFSDTHPRRVRLFYGFRNAQNSQVFVNQVQDLTAGTVTWGAPVNTATDFSVDQTMTITTQNGTSTDSQTFKAIIAKLENSFGPV